MKNIKRMSAWMLATVLAAGVSAVARAAGPLDDKVPADSILYFGWAGSDALAPQYAGSNLKGVVDASAAKEFIAQQLPKLLEMAGQRDPQAPQIIAKLQTGLGIAWHHPVAFYFCPLDLTDTRKPGFRLGIVCDAGADAKALTDLLNDAMSKAPPQPADEPQVKISSEGTQVCITVGKADTAAERAQGGGLAATPAYQKAMGQLKVGKPALAMYVDAAKILSMVNDGIAKSPDVPPEAKAKIGVVIDALGVGSLTQIATASGFDGKEWSEQAFAGVNGPRKGLLAMAGDKPLSDNVLAAVPKDAVAFAALKFDPQGVYDQIRTIAGKIDPQATQQIDQGVAMGNQQLGMDIEKDIIAPFGEEWVLYRAPLSDVGGNSFALVHKLRDGEKMAATIAKAEMMVNTLGQGRFKIDKLTAGKIEFSSVSFLQYSAAWTVRNGYLYVSTMDGLAGAVKQVENKSPSIAESDLYKKAIAGFPQGVKPLSIAYSNPAKVYPELRRLGLGVLPLARAAGFDIPAGILPDVDDVGAFMTPGASMSWVDADGFHMAGKSAFPGAQLVGGSPSAGPTTMAVAALGTAVLLPSLGKSREMANRTVDAANIRGLVLSCMVMATDNNDKMPDDPGKLIVQGSISPRQLVNRWSGTQPLEFTPDLQKLAKDDYPAFAAMVAAHSDYVYLGKGTTNQTDSSIVLFYDKPAPYLTDGMNVAYGDGHTEFTRWASIDQAFKPTNEYLKKMGLPTVDVADMLRKSGQAIAQMPMRAGTGLP